MTTSEVKDVVHRELQPMPPSLVLRTSLISTAQPTSTTFLPFPDTSGASLSRLPHPNIQCLPFETKDQARICKPEGRRCALLSSEVLPGSLVEMEGANVLLLCPKMLGYVSLFVPNQLRLVSGVLCLLPLSCPIILVMVLDPELFLFPAALNIVNPFLFACSVLALSLFVFLPNSLGLYPRFRSLVGALVVLC